MWKDYSSGYIKNNRSSSISVVVASFISAVLLSLLCGLFYNLWKYEVERIILEEGGWQSRIVCESDNALNEADIESIRNFATVKDVVVNETGIDLYFNHMRDVLQDTPRIARLAGISPERVTYHYQLLAMYLIRDSRDTAPRLLFPLFIVITGMASLSLIIIIHNSFAVSMNARIHQFGIFSSIGATPGQIRACLLQEAAALCAAPVVLGNLSGIVLGRWLSHLSNVLASGVAGRQEAVFGYHPSVFLVTMLVTVLTIWISAWLPARKLSRMTPLEAIRNTGELQLKRRKSSPILSLLFGVEGELAGNALKAQRKAMRTASLSLILSFMAFTLMQCFFATSQISTRETYFERYQDAWDIMVTVRDTEVDSFDETAGIQGLDGVKSAVVYQKAMAKRVVTEEEMSGEMKAFGGFSHASAPDVTQTDEGWLVNAPIVILDDVSFLEYCEQIGIAPQLDGAVVRNQICDVTNPDFRHPVYMPYVKGENKTTLLRASGNSEMTAEIPVLSYTEKVPVLREEYASLDHYELVHFMPVSLWKGIKKQIGGAEQDTSIRVLAGGNAELDRLNALQGEIEALICDKYTTEAENRIQEYDANSKQIWGMQAILGGFCVLLAIIGIGNVFSNTLGFVHQRKREFARYLSVGMTPEEIRKMFCIEAIVIAGHPILFTVPMAVLAVGYMLRLSYLEVETFMEEAPVLPIAVFMLSILGSVALAYVLGWSRMRGINLAEVLRDDTMI